LNCVYCNVESHIRSLAGINLARLRAERKQSMYHISFVSYHNHQRSEDMTTNILSTSMDLVVSKSIETESKVMNHNNNKVATCSLQSMSTTSNHNTQSTSVTVTSDIPKRKSSLFDLELEQKMADHFRRQTYRLFLLEHSKICNETNCKYKHCERVKELRKHMRRCQNPSCTVKGCIKSQILASHYKKCGKENCNMCAPVVERLRSDYCGDVKRRLSFTDIFCNECLPANTDRKLNIANMYDLEA